MPSAVINGETYTNYAMPKNSIDFNLKEAGYFNFFAGSYQHNTVTASGSTAFTLIVVNFKKDDYTLVVNGVTHNDTKNTINITAT